MDNTGRPVVVYAPSGEVARLASSFVPADLLAGAVPTGSLTYGAVYGLPEPTAGRLLLVSVLVKLACPDRADVAVVADEVRDDSGRIVGCRGLAADVTLES